MSNLDKQKFLEDAQNALTQANTAIEKLTAYAVSEKLSDIHGKIGQSLDEFSREFKGYDGDIFEDFCKSKNK